MSAKTTVRQLLGQELLNLCLSTNRGITTQTGPRKFSEEKVKEIRKAVNVMWSGTNLDSFMTIFAALMDAPELAAKKGSFPLFSVIVFEANYNGGMTVGSPYIVTHAEKKQWFNPDGKLGSWAFSNDDKPRLATEEEVAKCISELTDAQWKTIASDPLFAPITQAIFDKEIQLVEPVEKKKRTRKPKVTEQSHEPVPEVAF